MMRLTLTRRDFREDGIFGDLKDDKSYMLAVTLEHAYPSDGGGYVPKVPPGEYKCVRYLSPKHGYELFRLTGVPGHDFIELHVGNYNADSDGCVLLGKGMGHMSNGGRMIVNSKNAFKEFMEYMEGVDEFQLLVDDNV